MTAPKFATVVLDADSTISGIEGIDWLGERRGGAVAAEVVRLTDEAMRGTIALEAVYGLRLDAIRPSASDIHELSAAYVAEIAPRCRESVQKIRAAGSRVVVISGGIRQALLPLAAEIGVAPENVYAVDIHFATDGSYAGFDDKSPLATSRGKPDLLRTLALPRPILAVGDGATDLAMKGVADVFAAFKGFVNRPSVVHEADVVVATFTEVAELVLPP